MATVQIKIRGKETIISYYESYIYHSLDVFQVLIKKRKIIDRICKKKKERKIACVSLTIEAN